MEKHLKAFGEHVQRLCDIQNTIKLLVVALDSPDYHYGIDEITSSLALISRDLEENYHAIADLEDSIKANLRKNTKTNCDY